MGRHNRRVRAFPGRPRQIAARRGRSAVDSTFPRGERANRRKRGRGPGELWIANPRLKNSISRNTTDLIRGQSTAILDLGSRHSIWSGPDLCRFPGGRFRSPVAAGSPIAKFAGAKPGDYTFDRLARPRHRRFSARWSRLVAGEKAMGGYFSCDGCCGCRCWNRGLWAQSGSRPPSACRENRTDDDPRGFFSA